MKGTILDFLKLAAENPELAKELGELAKRHDFEFTDEVSDEQLEGVAGGTSNVGGVGGVAAQQQYQFDGLTAEQIQQQLQLFLGDAPDASGTSSELQKQRTFIPGR